MKFRDEDNLTAKILKASSSENLESLINDLDKLYDLVDLQYSTTGEFTHIEYSALALVRKKG